jgi:aryl-alcohol dehydrogenase-like predicted oxidoreductase
MMKTRAFGRDGQAVSEIGLGCWQLGGGCWGEIDKYDAKSIIDTALDGGVTFFDTADVYGGGRSEELLGEFLPKGEELFVATKLGRGGEGGWPDNFRPEVMEKHTEDSLRRLKVDALDLTQLHCIPTEQLREGEVFETLRKLQQKGKIKRFGASVESMEEARLCLDQEGLASLQIIFNVFRQKPIDECFDDAQAAGVALVIRLPLASGLLAGKFTADTTFPESDHRNFNRDGQVFNVGETFAGLGLVKGVELADRIKPLVPEGMTMAQMAQRWILDHDAATTVITGASRPDQAKANAAVSSLPPLPAGLHAQLRELYHDHVAEHIRGPY